MLWHCKGLTKKMKVTDHKKKSKENFNCNECNKVYTDRSGLRKHMKVHEKIIKQNENIVDNENNKVNESLNTVEEDFVVENHGPIENLVFICDQNQPSGPTVEQGQLQNIELVFIDESKADNFSQ